MDARKKKIILSLLALVAFATAAYGITINGQLIKAQFENLSSAPTGSTGRVYFDTTLNTAQLYNGSAWGGLGGSGAGAKNYVSAGASSVTGWTASGAGITAVTDSSAADLPEPTVATGLKVTGVSGSTAYVYNAFTLDPSDYNKKLSVQWNQNPLTGYVASDFLVSINSCTIAWSGGTCGGTSAVLALSTDVSAVSALPNLTGTYRTTFDSPGSSAKFIEVKIGLNTTATHAMVFSSITVGPGVVTQGAAYQNLGTVTVTPDATAFGTLGANQATAVRVGDVVTITGYFQQGTPTANPSLITLPYNIDTSKITASGTAIGYAQSIEHTAGASGLNFYGIYWKIGDAANVVRITNQTVSGNFQDRNASNINSEVSLAYTYVISYTVSTWAGSGTVNVVQNDCEYASNSSTATTGDDSASFAYGPAGTPFYSVTVAGKRRVRFRSPISATDVIIVEEQSASGAPWFPMIGQDYATGHSSWQNQNSVTYGIGPIFTSVNGTDIDIALGTYSGNLSTYGGTGRAWSTDSTYSWRVKKCSGAPTAGFSTYSPGVSAGLVKTVGYPPTTQVFTTATSQTYTTPAGVSWIEVTEVGAGGGGAGSGTGSPGAGSDGTASTFSGSGVTLTANGGKGGTVGSAGGAGGTASISGATSEGVFTGGSGQAASTNNAVSTIYLVGGAGGNSCFGGGGGGSIGATVGVTGGSNSGSGGGGGGTNATATSDNAGGGGGAGGCLKAIISAPAATYTYTAGSGGGFGAAGTLSGANGGSGAGGYIVVREHYL